MSDTAFGELPILKKLFTSSIAFVNWIDARIASVGGGSGVLASYIQKWLGAFFEFYGASGSYLEATGTIANNSNQVSITGAGASAFVASCAVGQEIYIAGAGNQGSGSDLIKPITAINTSTNVLTLNGNAARSATNVLVQHDDTEAVLATINSLFDPATGKYGDWINLIGHYKCNKGFHSTKNAIFYPPYLDETSETGFIGLRGLFKAGTIWNSKNKKSGVIISTLLNGSGDHPSLFAAKQYESTNSAGYKAAFNTMFVEIKNITFLAPNNHNLTVLNLNNFMCASVEKVNIEQQRHHSDIIAAGLAGKPATGSAGIIMPGINNAARNFVTNVGVIGCEDGLTFSEHVVFNDYYPFLCTNALVATRGFRPNHGHLASEHCPTLIDVRGQNSINLTVNLEKYELGSEWFKDTQYTKIKDSQDRLHGKIGYKQTVANVGDSNFDIVSVTGCSQVKFENIFSPFLNDDGGTLNAVVERQLPTAPSYVSGAIIKDEFKTSGNWNNRTPDVLTVSGNKWEVTDGYGYTAENKLLTAESGLSLGLIDAGKANNRLYVKRAYASPGLILRAVDHLNHFFVGFGDYNSIEIYKVVGGVLGSPLSSDAITTTINLSVSISSDNIIRVYDESNNVIKSLSVGTDYASATKVGLRTGSYGEFERFQVV